MIFTFFEDIIPFLSLVFNLFSCVYPDEEASKVMEMAEEQGISIKTLKRAKSVLGVNSAKRNGQWYWEMPVETQFIDYEETQGGQGCHMALLSSLTPLNESGVM
jgi:hypothetical protein